jgi:hypothetical protein
VSLGSVKELRVHDSVKTPKRRQLPWRLIGLCLAFGVSAVVWLAIFWAIGYYF